MLCSVPADQLGGPHIWADVTDDVIGPALRDVTRRLCEYHRARLRYLPVADNAHTSGTSRPRTCDLAHIPQLIAAVHGHVLSRPRTTLDTARPDRLKGVA